MNEKEYIEREAAVKRFTFATLDCLGMEPQIRASDVVKAIDAIPAADVVEVRHGRWVWDGYVYEAPWQCSNCGVFHDVDSNYCPNCGAKMDAKEAETT